MKTLTQLIVPLLLGALVACGGNPNAGPVTVSPKTATVKAGDPASFTATVEGAKEPKVLWSVEGGDSHGTITGTGVYTAPTEAGTYTVVATNAVDTSKKDTATVTVLPAVVVSIEPATASVATAGTTTFTARVTGTEDTSVTWSLQEGEAGGAITGAGVYTAPTTAGTYTVVATSKADPSRKGTAQVKVVPVGVTLNPSTVTLDQGATHTFTADVTLALDKAVTWSVEGGDSPGTVTSSGVYTAPLRAGSYTLVATSVADPTKRGTATVTVRAVEVKLTPETVRLLEGGSTTFTATVTGTTGSTAVTWSAEGGSIDGAGRYTAPRESGTFRAVATSVADPSQKGTATITTVPVASGLDYTNPPGTGWRFLKNKQESTAHHLVLDLVGPAGASGRGVDLTLSADPAHAGWVKVSGADTERVTNRAFSLGGAPQLLKGTVKDNTLLVGVFQKGAATPASPLGGAVLSVALQLKPDPQLPAGSALPLSVLKAHALLDNGPLGQIDVAVGSLTTQ
jgi:hypothetical protein